MSLVFTPNDGALDVFTLHRSPDKGNVELMDLGHEILETAGGQRFVFERGPEERRYLLAVSGLSALEYELLRDYIEGVLNGAGEGFTLSWRTRRNLLAETRDLTKVAKWTVVAGAGLTVAWPSAELTPGGSSLYNRIVMPGGAPTTGNYIEQIVGNPIPGQAYTASVRVAGSAGEPDSARLQLVDSLGVIAEAAFTPIDEEQRITVTGTQAGVATNLRWRLRRTSGASTSTTLDVRHPQLELGSSASRFQPVEEAFDLINAHVALPVQSGTWRGEDVVDYALRLRRLMAPLPS